MRKLTSLLLVEERLFEAEYFALQLKDKYPLELQFQPNAFLSAARSVTFLMQKELAHVEGFKDFWDSIQETWRNDKAARFFVELRNFSQKEGRVGLVGWGGVAKPKDYQFPQNLGAEPEMLYFFSGRETSVPEEISKVDIVVACLRHTAKLAKLILATMEHFPFATCPSIACTVEGAKHFGWELEDFLEVAGLPRGWICGSKGLAIEDAFRVVSLNFDAVDGNAIAAIAKHSDL